MDDKKDKGLFSLLYSWKEVAGEFNHRLDIMEQQIIRNPSPEKVTVWQTKLSRTGKTLPSVKVSLKKLLEVLVTEYSAESGIGRNTVLFE